MFLDEKTKEIFDGLLGVSEQIKAAEISGYSPSTVRNIIARRTHINRHNKVVVEALKNVSYKKIQDTERFMVSAKSHLKNTNYNNIDYGEE